MGLINIPNMTVIAKASDGSTMKYASNGEMAEPKIAKGYVGLIYLQQAVAMLPPCLCLE